mgnify:CR=1 FL=1
MSIFLLCPSASVIDSAAASIAFSKSVWATVAACPGSPRMIRARIALISALKSDFRLKLRLKLAGETKAEIWPERSDQILALIRAQIWAERSAEIHTHIWAQTQIIDQIWPEHSAQIRGQIKVLVRAHISAEYSAAGIRGHQRSHHKTGPCHAAESWRTCGSIMMYSNRSPR